MATYLDAIVAAHRAAAQRDPASVSRWRDDAIEAHRSSPARRFGASLRDPDRPGLAVIAEVKRRSPSKGALNVDLDPAALAEQYEAGGASCLSVLTDADHFGGSADDLRAARAAVSLPVLRKDFTVCEVDVYEARVMGADAVLLIAAVLDDRELADFHALALEIGLDALVEIHDENELERALAVGAAIVGVNQRDLHTFQVDQERAVRVGRLMPDHVVRVAESGVRGPRDAAALAAAGFDAVLVGEHLVTSGDAVRGVRALIEAGRSCS